MNKQQMSIIRDAILMIAAFAFVLFVYNAVPFVAIPTVGQAVWTTGFSQSFANQSIFSIYANNFGAPEPAAIAFGLAGAWPAALLIKSGLHPADAYSGMVALWLGVAFLSAYKIARIFEVRRVLALLAAILWMSMPIVLGHTGYSMVSLGLGLLPFYFLAAWNLFLADSALQAPVLLNAAIYITAAVIAVFMDGYSFMMFAAGSSLICAYAVLVFPNRRKRLFKIGVPIHLCSFALAYVLYTSYIGRTEFQVSPSGIFRSMGLDLSFVVLPTRGMHWVFDVLGLSTERSAETYFGDFSVWSTTFSLPIILAGMFGWWRVRRHTQIASGLLLLAVFGFYMALGPSLKINARRTDHAISGQRNELMPREVAIAPTGNAWLSENLPGFNAMRASYRWSALGVFAFWMLFVLFVGKRCPKSGVFACSALVGLIMLNLPDLSGKLKRSAGAREMFFHIDADLVADIDQALYPNERVAFLPYRNDFLINYMAARVDIRAYNVGGDKNLEVARTHWPIDMKIFNAGQLDRSHIRYLLLLLLNDESDVVVIPYFHSLHAASLWPCVDETKTCPSETSKNYFDSIADFDCPTQIKHKFAPVIRDLSRVPYLDVKDSRLYATVRLRPEFLSEKARSVEMNKIVDTVTYPYPITFGPNANINIVMNEGWHVPNANLVWSSAASTLSLPVPKGCQNEKCLAVLKFGVFGASPQRLVPVRFTAKDGFSDWNDLLIASGGDKYEMSIPLQGETRNCDFLIEVSNATSPNKLSDSPDERTLGISLQRVDLVVDSLPIEK